MSHFQCDNTMHSMPDKKVLMPASNVILTRYYDYYIINWVDLRPIAPHQSCHGRVRARKNIILSLLPQNEPKASKIKRTYITAYSRSNMKFSWEINRETISDYGLFVSVVHCCVYEQFKWKIENDANAKQYPYISLPFHTLHTLFLFFRLSLLLFLISSEEITKRAHHHHRTAAAVQHRPRKATIRWEEKQTKNVYNGFKRLSLTFFISFYLPVSAVAVVVVVAVSLHRRFR